MQQIKEEINLEYLKEEIKGLDPNLKEDDIAYSHALLLLASLVVGTSVKKIAGFTNLDFGLVKDAVKLLRKNGVFVGRKVHADWFDEKYGATAFWLDVCIADGLVERAK